MSIRENLDKHKKVTLTISAISVAVAIYMVVAQARETTTSTEAVSSAYFSSDDGASYFGGSAPQTWELQAKNPPSYPAAVYETRDGKERFVAYLTRLPPEALQERSTALAEYNRVEPTLTGIEHTKHSEAYAAQMASIMGSMEIKRSGPKDKWVLMRSREGQDIQTNIKSPSGSTDVRVVYP